ncbi:hypothetical protein quinque_000111 [Culex quinquefasciatus]
MSTTVSEALIFTLHLCPRSGVHSAVQLNAEPCRPVQGAVRQTQPNRDHYNLFLAYVTRLLLPLYNHLNIFHNSSIPSSLGQTRLTKLTADWACSMDFSDCVQNSLQLFTTWITTSSNPIPPELRTTVYCTAIREGTQREWDFLWTRYRDPATVSAERTAIAEGLACTEDPELMDRLLRWSVDSSSELRLEDTTVVFEAIADQVGGTAMAKQFLFDNIDKMADYVNPETFESRLASHVKALQEINQRYSQEDPFKEIIIEEILLSPPPFSSQPVSSTPSQQPSNAGTPSVEQKELNESTNEQDSGSEWNIGESFQVLESAPSTHKYLFTVFQTNNAQSFFKAVQREHRLLRTGLPPGVWV